MNEFEQIQADYNAAYDRALTSKREFAFAAVKEFSGRDGTGYSANVTRNGKKVGEVVDEGNGGAPYLRLDRDEHTAFLAEGRTFYGDDAVEWHVEEGYPSILVMAADIARKRSTCVTADSTPLGNGEYMTLKGGNTDPKAVAVYLLSAKSGLADQNPKIWVKAQGRFVPAADLI